MNGHAQQRRAEPPTNGCEGFKWRWRGEMSARQGFEIKDVDDAYFAAEMLHRTGYGGKSNNTAAKCFAAIMLGQRLGVDPYTATNRIAVINGMPCAWGDLAMGLVLRSGLLEDFEETEEGEGDDLTAICRIKRKGIPTQYVGRWSVGENKTAGLEGRNVHKSFPKRMRQMRARGFALRDAFGDILMGLYLSEELVGLRGLPHDMVVDETLSQVDLDSVPNGERRGFGFKGGESSPVAPKSSDDPEAATTGPTEPQDEPMPACASVPSDEAAEEEAGA